MMMLRKTRYNPDMNLKYFSHFFPRTLSMDCSTSLSLSEVCRTYILQVEWEMNAERARTMLQLISPESLKMTGSVSRAPPNMLLYMARMLETDEFFLT